METLTNFEKKLITVALAVVVVGLIAIVAIEINFLIN